MLIRIHWKLLTILRISQFTHCAYLRLYSDETTLTNYAEMPLSNAENLLNSDYYNNTRKNFIYSFGFSDKPEGESVSTIMKEIITLREYNAFVVNWKEEASVLTDIFPPSLERHRKSISMVVNGVSNGFFVATELGEALIRMSHAGFDLTRTYMSGHSLGAQLVGQAARTAAGAGCVVERIYGLEPSGHNIYGEFLPSLNAGDAKTVICVHTDPARYGINMTMCDIDIMVNYEPFTQPDKAKQVQPGCPEGNFEKYTTNDACSHIRCWKLFAEGIRSPGKLVASRADNIFDWDRGQRDCSDTIFIGIDEEHTKRGVYYISTSSTEPYGLGSCGSCPTDC